MYLEKVKKLINEIEYIPDSKIFPCNLEEVVNLEKKLNLKIPEALKEFLLWCGYGLGIVFNGDAAFYNCMIGNSEQYIDINELAIELFTENNFIPPENIIAITLHGGYEFHFITANEGEDPPVYYYIEGSSEIRKDFNSFSDFIINEIIQTKQFAKYLTVSGWEMEILEDPPVPKKLVENIHFNGVNFKDLPENLFDYYNLKNLDAYYCHLEKIPQEIIKLNKLEDIRLNDNNFINFPEILLKLDNIKRIDISNNKIKEINIEENSQIPNLEYLNLSKNKFSEFPDSLKYLSNLKNFDFSANKIKKFPNEIFNLKNLETLSLSFCDLEEIPSEIIELNKLKQIYLAGNNLTKFPYEILKLPNIERINIIQYNNISNEEIEQIRVEHPKIKIF